METLGGQLASRDAPNSAEAPPGLIANHEHLPFATDGGIGDKARMGLLVLRTDQTIEDEFRFLLPDAGVALYGARLYNDAEISPETLREMEPLLASAAALLPDGPLPSVGFACTSGALVIGEDRVAARVREARPDTAVTDPVTAMLAAMAALSAKRIALLTPYVTAINERLRAALVARGLEVPVMGSFNEPDDNIVASIAPESLEEAICGIGASDACDAVFVSCTSLRLARRIARVEARLGKPVTSSNHALAWHMLRLAGVDEPLPGRGRLFELPLAG